LGRYRLERADQLPQGLAPPDTGQAAVGVANDDDAVQVVGHDDPFVESHVQIAGRKPLPAVDDCPAKVGMFEPIVYHCSQNRQAIAHADRHEVGACLRVVVAVQSNGPAMVDLGIA
jgi:hypothetical protein